MGSSEKFCLRWNDFESNISVAFRELREEKDFFDVTLACDDSQIQAHKVILSACSPFFRNVLRRNPHQHPLLYLKGVKYKELLSVLNFMYMGEVNVAQEELNSFLAVAEDLRVKGLTQNNSSSEAKPKSEPPKISRPPPPREPQERDPVPPPKRPRPAPQVVAPQQSYHQEEDDDIQEVVPVKSEPRDPVPMPSTPMTTAMAPVDNSISHYQTEQVVTHTPTMVQQPQNTVALDDSYADESYDYGQYGDAGYDDGSGMIDPNTGMPMQGAGADGNKDYDLECVISSKMTRDSLTGDWTCHDCGFGTKLRQRMSQHVESKHIGADSTCEICMKSCPTRNALRVHKFRNHRNELM